MRKQDELDPNDPDDLAELVRLADMDVPAGCRVRNLPEPFFKGYDAPEDGLANVGGVKPAKFKDKRVSTDGVTDGYHLLVEAVTRRGDKVHLLVSNRGWAAVSYAPVAVGPAGGPRYDYDRQRPFELGYLRLSLGDRQKLVAAALEHFFGKADWAQLQAWKRAHPSPRRW